MRELTTIEEMCKAEKTGYIVKEADKETIRGCKPLGRKLMFNNDENIWDPFEQL